MPTVRSFLTVADLDKPLTPSRKGTTAISNFLRGITYDDLQKQRDEVLSTKKEHIRDYSDLVEKLLAQNILCVYGNEKKLRESKDIFESLEPVLE